MIWLLVTVAFVQVYGTLYFCLAACSNFCGFNLTLCEGAVVYFQEMFLLCNRTAVGVSATLGECVRFVASVFYGLVAVFGGAVVNENLITDISNSIASGDNNILDHGVAASVETGCAGVLTHPAPTGLLSIFELAKPFTSSAFFLPALLCLKCLLVFIIIVLIRVTVPKFKLETISKMG
jgi:hypothetical protein